MQEEREDSQVWFALFPGRGILCRGGTLRKDPLYQVFVRWNLDRPKVRGRTCQAWGSWANSWRLVSRLMHCLHPVSFSLQLRACSARSLLCGECLPSPPPQGPAREGSLGGGGAPEHPGAGRALQQHQMGGPHAEGHTVSWAATGTGSLLWQVVFRTLCGDSPGGGKACFQTRVCLPLVPSQLACYPLQEGVWCMCSDRRLE